MEVHRKEIPRTKVQEILRNQKAGKVKERGNQVVGERGVRIYWSCFVVNR